MGLAELLSVPVALAPIALIVDDDPRRRRKALTTMTEVEVNAAEARSAEDALAYLREHAPDVGFLVTKLELAGRADGIDLARVASLRWPWIKVLVEAFGERMHDVPGNVVFLPTPWGAADIRAHLQWEAARAGATRPQTNTGRLIVDRERRLAKAPTRRALWIR